MNNTVTIADYDGGNVLSVSRAIIHLGGRAVLSGDPRAVARAERLILPGVGAFGACIDGLRERRLDEAVMKFAETGRPFLGICVGMQMMFEVSEEFGEHRGLAMLKGQVRAIPPNGADGAPHRIPHIGWNALYPPKRTWADTMLGQVAEGDSMYFVHSFSCHPEDREDVLAVCHYGGVEIIAAVNRGPLMGCQFHPEKSGKAGLAVLDAFLKV